MKKFIILCQRKPRNGNGKKISEAVSTKKCIDNFISSAMKKLGLAPQKILQENTKEQFISF